MARTSLAQMTEMNAAHLRERNTQGTHESNLAALNYVKNVFNDPRVKERIEDPRLMEIMNTAYRYETPLRELVLVQEIVKAFSSDIGKEAC